MEYFQYYIKVLGFFDICITDIVYMDSRVKDIWVRPTL